MSFKENREPRERILDAAIMLFAKKGFAAVGVREIAALAEVNIAMISYYFEGKVGILRAIIEEFFAHYCRLLSDIDDESRTPEECVRTMIQRIIDYVRKNTELTMVVYNELPLDIHEIAEMKAEKITELIRSMSGFIRRFGLDPENTFQISMIGPSLFSMIFTNFRLKPVLQHVFKVKFDDIYYERMTETLSTLFLNGIHAVSNQKRRQGERR